MDGIKSLKRYFQTRRFTGRRGITPMKSKHRKTVPKTRSHKVEKKPYVPIRKHTSSHVQSEWKEPDKEKHCEDTQREGNQDSHQDRGWKSEEEHAQIEPIRNTENSEKSIHPGPVQTLSEMCECADDKTSGETEIEAEELH